ncbi:MAG: sodium:proline symporter, partial [Planctomycetota bacterium]
MQLQAIDWFVIGAYVVFAISVGMALARRASRSVDEFFLSGRTLPWWIAGTSMVATSFAADTPLVVTGWVRDFGIWKNWLWWCYCTTSMLGVFIFVRLWRRGGVMTKAELAELRYGGPEAKVLRGTLGVFHAFLTNTIVLCWVMLAAAKIAEGLFEIDKALALTIACALSMSYSLLSGFWGVVLTDLLQFIMSVVGAIVLAAFAWHACSGMEGIQAAISNGAIDASRLQLFPGDGDWDFWRSDFWTAPIAGLCVYFGLSWWAAEIVDGSGVTVQRVAACRDERHGVLAVLWFTIAHYALRPWPWIVVALASLVILPTIEIEAPVAGKVHEVIDADGVQAVLIDSATGRVRVPIVHDQATADWGPIVKVKAG